MTDREYTGSMYLREISRQPILSVEEERELVSRWKEGGDARAREKLIAANLRHVMKLAWKLRCYGMPIEDLVAEGALGLIEGGERYKLGRGTRFFTYAAWWVRAHMMRAVINHYRKGRSGALNKHFWHVRRANGLSTDNEAQKVEEICRTTGLDEGDAVWALAAIKGDGVADYVSCPAETADELAERNERVEMLLEAMDRTLSVKEYVIIKSLFLGRDAATLKAVGEEQGVTRERIRQKRIMALRKLRKYLKVA